MVELSRYKQLDPTSKNTAVVRANADQENKIYEQMMKTRLSQETKMHEERIKLMEHTRAAIIQAEKDGNSDAVKELNRKLGGFKAAETEYAKQVAKIRNDAIQVAIEFETNQYNKMSAHKRMEYSKAIAKELSDKKESLTQLYDLEMRELQQLQEKGNLTKKEEARVEFLKESTQKTKGELDSADAAIRNAEELFNRLATSSEKAKKAAEDYAKAEQHRAEVLAEETSEQEELQKQLKAAKTKDEKDELKKKIKASKDNVKRANDEAQAALDAKKAAEEKARTDKTLEEQDKERSDKKINRINKTISTVDKLSGMASSAIDTALSNMYDQQARMQGRLQGSNVGWTSALNKVSTNIGVSPIASQQKVVEQMVKLVDSGVAHNLELRAFLAETSESIASTFDAFDANLLRLIRLQQADSTAARLGMEATLTKFFNQSFQDSGYLAEQVSDSVAAAILDASATMSRNDSLAFEYTVQKWLGSLYSLGMSSEAVTGIAKGINYLATGNVTALSGNTALQTLFSMSAGRTSKSYTDMLTGGISASETNDLLKSMVELLSGIAENTDNRVLSSAYAELFDMSLTDLRTFTSLTANDISNIYASTVDYGGLINETTSQLTQVVSRKNMSQIIDTVIENAMTGAAQNIGSNPITYGLWKALNLVDSLVDIEIPGITVVGSGTTSAIDVLNIAKLGFAGMGLVTSLVEALASGSGGATSLSAWGNAERMSSRGSPLSVLSGGSSQGTSLSASLGVGGADASTISDVSFETAQETAHESAGVTSEELQESKETPQKIFDAIAGDSTPTVLSLLQEIDDRLDPGRVFYTAIAGVLSHDVVSTVTNLSSQIAVAKANISAEGSSENTSNPIGEVAGNIINNVTNKAGGAKSADGTSGFGFYDEDEDIHSLQSIIAAAIAEGLQQYGWSNRMPVEITTQGGAG